MPTPGSPSRHRTPPADRARGAMLACIATAMGVCACGASINAIYESDVRFEQCMALDSRADVKPTLRRACWQEWLSYYNVGQTRDRLEWARGRIRQLQGASDFAVEEIGESTASLAVPEPTSVMAPPPMMLATDAGAPPLPAPEVLDAGVASADAGGVPVGPESAECVAECDEVLAFCRQECATPACDKTCAGKHKRCMRRCF